MMRETAQRAGYGSAIRQSAEQTRPHYLHPHNLREAFVTNWLDKRDDTFERAVLQTILGHEHFETTAR